MKLQSFLCQNNSSKQEMIMMISKLDQLQLTNLTNQKQQKKEKYEININNKNKKKSGNQQQQIGQGQKITLNIIIRQKKVMRELTKYNNNNRI